MPSRSGIEYSATSNGGNPTVSVSTTGTDKLLVAQVATAFNSGEPTVSGGGLTWVKIANTSILSQAHAVYVAWAATAITSQTITANVPGGSYSAFTVQAWQDSQDYSSLTANVDFGVATYTEVAENASLLTVDVTTIGSDSELLGCIHFYGSVTWTNQTNCADAGTPITNEAHIRKIERSDGPLSAGTYTIGSDHGQDNNWRGGGIIAFEILGAAGGGGGTGDASETLEGLAFSATGELPIEADASETLEGLAFSATGELPIEADASETLEGLTFALEGEGQITTTATANETLEQLSFSAIGEVEIRATATVTLEGLSFNADGEVAIEAEATETLEGLTFVARSGSTTQADANLTLEEMTFSAEGEIVIEGQASVTLEGLTAASTGNLPITSEASETLEGLTFEATLEAEGLKIGSATIVLEGLTTSFQGELPIVGASTAILTGLQPTFTGRFVFGGVNVDFKAIPVRVETRFFPVSIETRFFPAGSEDRNI